VTARPTLPWRWWFWSSWFSCVLLCAEGEIKVCELEKVFRYDTYSSHKSGQTGTLFVTNFKVSFVTLKLDQSADYVVGSSAVHLPYTCIIFSLTLMCVRLLRELRRDCGLSSPSEAFQLLGWMINLFLFVLSSSSCTLWLKKNAPTLADYNYDPVQ